MLVWAPHLENHYLDQPQNEEAPAQETLDRVDGSYHLSPVVVSTSILILHIRKLRQMRKTMTCPRMCLLTNNECKQSDFSKQIQKGVTETNT